MLKYSSENKWCYLLNFLLVFSGIAKDTLPSSQIQLQFGSWRSVKDKLHPKCDFAAKRSARGLGQLRVQGQPRPKFPSTLYLVFHYIRSHSELYRTITESPHSS